jgi:hypothetical protein
VERYTEGIGEVHRKMERWEIKEQLDGRGEIDDGYEPSKEKEDHTRRK